MRRYERFSTPPVRPVGYEYLCSGSDASSAGFEATPRSLSFSMKKLLGRRHGKEQCSGLTGQSSKSEALVKSHGLIVFGVDQKRECCGIRLQGPGGGIGHERPTQATTLKSLVHGQPPDANSGNCGISRQPLDYVRGKIDEGDTRGGYRVPGGDRARDCFYRNEAISDMPSDVLGYLCLKIAIQHIFAAAK